MSNGIVTAGGDTGSNTISGTPQKADNTGRDWGQGIGLGAAAVGTLLGSIFSFGSASVPLIALDTAATAATIANDKIQDDSQNAEQARAMQKQLDTAQAARPTAPSIQMANMQGGPQDWRSGQMGSGAITKAAGGGGVQGIGNFGSIQAKPNDFSGFKSQPVVEQAPTANNNPEMSFDGTSDRRAKKNIASGNAAAQDFLSLVRARGAWPKGVKDV